MILGILLAVSISINLTSLILIITSSTGILKENLATGAVIGVGQLSSYSITAFVISLITTVFLILKLKKRQPNPSKTP